MVDDLGFASALGSLSVWIGAGAVTYADAEALVSATLAGVVAEREVGRRTEDDRVLAIVQGLAIADLGLAEVCRRKILGAATEADNAT